MKKNYQAPESKNVMLLSQITMQKFGVGVGSAMSINVGSIVNGTPVTPIQTE